MRTLTVALPCHVNLCCRLREEGRGRLLQTAGCVCVATCRKPPSLCVRARVFQNYLFKPRAANPKPPSARRLAGPEPFPSPDASSTPPRAERRLPRHLRL